jgi:hypothetical protein
VYYDADKVEFFTELKAKDFSIVLWYEFSLLQCTLNYLGRGCMDN